MTLPLEHDQAALLARARTVAPAEARSFRAADGAVAWLEEGARPLALLVVSGHPALARAQGERLDLGDGLTLVRGDAGPAHAALLRSLFSDLGPVPLGLATSAGFGDRLGLATPGHVEALRRADAGGRIRPIFAQQSIREMTRTGRTPQEVLDDATWGAFEAGWRGAVGADADHLKSEEHVRTCLAAGFTFFTFDPGDHVDDDAALADEASLREKVAALPWDDLGDRPGDLRRRWIGRRIEAEGLDLDLDEAALLRAAAKYGAALAHAARLHRTLAGSGAPFEIELSVDETATPTTWQEHVFIALELRRLGVPLVSLAPRFVGRFEKGIDYRGDHAELVRSLDGHARIARAYGPYKLSLHSGSDKFSVYGAIAEATRGLVHLKTAGTSYLEALRVAAAEAPAFFREILTLARERFETDRASYHVSASLAAVPEPLRLGDAELPALLDDDDARQVLHVTFGSALDAHRPALLALLRSRREAYEATLARHFERHLRPIAPFAREGA
jgi:tagaturonate epimerase